MNRIVDKVSSFIKNHHLLSGDGRYLVALSGGADSVTLLLILHDLGYHIEAAHCNFHLRGSESNRDERFCRQLCGENNIPLHIEHFDTRLYAKQKHISIEMAARDLRYDFFERLCGEIAARGVCTAHHMDDSVETFLINLARGTGIAGLTGIAPKRGNVIRPLLCLTRKETEKFLNDRRQSYVVDSTNLIPDVQRNKVRLQLIPIFETINPQVRRNIMKTASLLYENSSIVFDKLQESFQWIARADSIKEFPTDKIKYETHLWFLLKDYGFSSDGIGQIYKNLHAQSGRIWASSTHEVLLDRGRLLLMPVDREEKSELRIPSCGTYLHQQLEKIEVTIEERDVNSLNFKDGNRIYLDASKVEFPLVVRTVRQGDRFIPYGMKGRKLLSDFMTDMKMSRFEMRRQLVLTDKNGVIMWVVGKRTDNRFRVSNATSKILKILLHA